MGGGHGVQLAECAFSGGFGQDGCQQDRRAVVPLVPGGGRVLGRKPRGYSIPITTSVERPKGLRRSMKMIKGLGTERGRCIALHPETRVTSV